MNFLSLMKSLFSSIKVINESTQNHDDLEWWREISYHHLSLQTTNCSTFLYPNYQPNTMWTTHINPHQSAFLSAKNIPYKHLSL